MISRRRIATVKHVDANYISWSYESLCDELFAGLCVEIYAFACSKLFSKLSPLLLIISRASASKFMAVTV